jgi:hypothetical protein
MKMLRDIITQKDIRIRQVKHLQIIILASARIVCNIAFCKCEVESTGKWSNIGVLFNQPHFNLVPKV